ncbi:MAG TPA: ribonuclease P protein component [Actinomycetota bacterium]|nr:ribonuclease P protein component [Actinomycetota bacterium]
MPGEGPRAGPGSPPRLRSGREIRRVLRTGSSHRSTRVILYRAPGGGASRAAWLAGRRVGGAVARNRARRLLREAWRQLWPRTAGGSDVVLVARGPFDRTRSQDLVHEIEELLTRAGMIR